MAASKLRRLADELDGIAEEPTSPNIHVHVGETGRFSAVESPTNPVNPPPSSPPLPLKALAIIREFKSWPPVVALGICVAGVVALLWGRDVGGWLRGLFGQ